MAPSRDSCGHKLFRARHHLNEFCRIADEWLKSNRYTTWLEPDPASAEYTLLKASAEAIPEDPFSLVIGDAIQNFRSCLDHLAYQLASAYTKPLPDDVAKDSQFPIVGDVSKKGLSGSGPEMFKTQLSRIRGMHPDAQAIIKGLQPYHRGNKFNTDPLWLLAELSNVDKHRTIHLVTMFSGGMLWHRDGSGVWPFKGTGAMQVFAGPVEHDTVIARIPLAQAKVNVNFKPAISIAFADAPCAMQDVKEALWDIDTHIAVEVLSGRINNYLF